jgi:hypothetical protein
LLEVLAPAEKADAVKTQRTMKPGFQRPNGARRAVNGAKLKIAGRKLISL